MHIKLDFQKLQASENIAELLNEDELRHVGGTVSEWYDKDKESRAEWEKANKNALKLALQITEQKSYPWPGASNVKFSDRHSNFPPEYIPH